MKQLVAVRFIKRRDLEDVVATEACAHAMFDESEASRAWTEKEFLDFLSSPKTRGYVVDEGKVVVGYLLVNYADADFLEVTRLTVHPDYRRAGFGSALLEKVVDLQEKLGRKESAAFVYESDSAAQQFFKAQKWSSKTARGKFGRGKDAVKFTCKAS